MASASTERYLDRTGLGKFWSICKASFAYGDKGKANKAKEADHAASADTITKNPEIKDVGDAITVTVGDKTPEEFTVPYAVKSKYWIGQSMTNSNSPLDLNNLSENINGYGNPILNTPIPGDDTQAGAFMQFGHSNEYAQFFAGYRSNKSDLSNLRHGLFFRKKYREINDTKEPAWDDWNEVIMIDNNGNITGNGSIIIASEEIIIDDVFGGENNLEKQI